MSRLLFTGFTFVCIFILAGCVTTSSVAPINNEVAHDKRIELGMKYLEIGKHDNARRQFVTALELNSKSGSAYQGIAMVHFAHGELVPAGVAFKKALKYSNKSNRSDIEVAYAKYLMDAGEIDTACGYFEAAAKNYGYSSRVDAMYYAGQCAAKRGDLIRMKGAYEHVMNLDRNYVPVLLDLANIYFKDGDFANSKKLLDRYDSLAQPSAASLWLGIRIERIFGNKDKESSYVMALKNRHPYSEEYLEYRKLLKQ